MCKLKLGRFLFRVEKKFKRIEKVYLEIRKLYCDWVLILMKVIY